MLNSLIIKILGYQVTRKSGSRVSVNQETRENQKNFEV